MIFKFYVEEWAFGNYSSWHEFESNALPRLHGVGTTKPIAPEHTLLATNLQTVLGIVKEHYFARPIIRNVLLFLHNGASMNHIPLKAGSDFEVVPVDYSEAAIENFIRLKM